MLSVVVVLAVLGLSGVLIARAGRALHAQRFHLDALPRDVIARDRDELRHEVDALDAALAQRHSTRDAGAPGPASRDDGHDVREPT